MDSDSLMRPKDGPYKFELLPQFWEFIDRKSIEGVIASSIFVYQEIMDAYEDDPLRRWAEARSGPPLFQEPNEAVQRCLNEVADFVMSRVKKVRQLAAKIDWPSEGRRRVARRRAGCGR